MKGARTAYKPFQGILLATDVDGTIVDGDSLFEFFGRFGFAERARSLDSANPGSDVKLVLEQIARRQRVPIGEFEEVGNRARLFSGAMGFYSRMEARGMRVCLLTATYEPIARIIAQRIGLRRPILAASRLRIEGNRVVGLKGRAMEGDEKRKALLRICKKAGVPLSRAVGIGDSAGDAPFLNLIEQNGGLSIMASPPDFRKIERKVLEWLGGKKDA